MGIFNQSGAATTANQNVANTVAKFVIRRATGNVDEAFSEINKTVQRKYFALQMLLASTTDGFDCIANKIVVYAKASDHDKRGRDYQVLVIGKGWSAYCTVSAAVSAVIESNADLKAMARPVGTKTDKCPDAFDAFFSAFGDPTSLAIAKYPVELTGENPTYPEKTNEDGKPSGEFIYFNDRLCTVAEVGDPMTDDEKLAHPAFKAYMAAKAAESADNSNDAA